MSEQVLFVGTYDIPEGSFGEFKQANREMTEFARANEPRVLSFNTYVNEAGTEATSIHLHPDSVSLEYHLETASQQISRGVQMLQVKRIELYGKPSQRVVAQLRRVSEQAGGFPVIVKTPLHGFFNLRGEET